MTFKAVIRVTPENYDLRVEHPDLQAPLTAQFTEFSPVLVQMSLPLRKEIALRISEGATQIEVTFTINSQ